ncbi:MAG: tRNA lysidine(34) synthetase TilS [Pseudomonadota bacterium]
MLAAARAERPVVAVACSGGRDSLALLHACLRLAAPMGLHVAALHVHHGLQPAADAWAAAVERRCRRWARAGWPVSCQVARLALSPERGDSIEAVARQARYAALARLAREAGATLILLGHHRRDQAETVLLQALRGAAAAGLAAMPRQLERDGLVWARPWLDQPREAIEAYARARRLRFVDDASNADPRHARSRLRLQVWPALSTAFPQTEAALAQVAAQAADAAAVLDEVGRADLRALDDGRPGLALAAWRGLSPARQRNVLRLWCRTQSGRPAARTLIERLVAEAPLRGDACWPATGGTWRCHRGRLSWVPGAGERDRRPVTAAGDRAVEQPPALPPGAGSEAASLLLGPPISGAGAWAFAGWAGVLQVTALPAAAPGDDEAPPGIPCDLLPRLQPRARAGGESLQLGAGRPPRSLKKQFQSADVPAWARRAPLWWAGEQLVYVPGVGLDSRCCAPADQPRFALRWHADGTVAVDHTPGPASAAPAAD